MLLFPHFMLPCRSVLPNIRTCSAFWLQDWSFISSSIVHVTRSMGWRLGMGGVKYSVTVLEAFPLSHSIKMLFVFHNPWQRGSTIVACIHFPNISEIFCHTNDDASQTMLRPLHSMRTLTRDDEHYNFLMVSKTSWNYCKNLLSQDSYI